MKATKLVLYLFSLFVISLGAALSIKANLGTSPLICIPYVLSLITNLSVGTTSFFFSVLLVIIQIILLKDLFPRIQYFQVVMGLAFSVFMDFSLFLVDFLNPTDYLSQITVLLLSCVVIAFGVLLEVKTELVFLPADGFIVAFAKAYKKEFGKIKPFIDVSFVLITIILSIVFLGHLAGVREGTVISAIIIGPIVRLLKKHLGSYIDKMI